MAHRMCCADGLAAAVLAVLSSGAQAQNPSTAPAQAPWQLTVWADEQSVADGLPVLALGRDDWYRGLKTSDPTHRAQRHLQGGITATHPNGWRLGALARTYAHLEASGDTVALAAWTAQKQDPPAGAFDPIATQSWGWSGAGLQVGTPWLPWPGQQRWRWRADAQWLQLMKLRHNRLQGQIDHQGGGVYDIRLSADRWGNQIEGPFLARSDTHGWGASVSLALAGEPAPGWHVGVRADDLLSRLHWSQLARETSVIDSAVSSRAPDGSLDYAAVVNGQQTVGRWQQSMAVRWQLDVRRTVTRPGAALTWRSTHREGLQQHWLGWDSAVNEPLAWRVAVEPRRQVLSGSLQWRGLTLELATDGKGTAQTQYRSGSLRWNLPL